MPSPHNNHQGLSSGEQHRAQQHKQRQYAEDLQQDQRRIAQQEQQEEYRGLQEGRGDRGSGGEREAPSNDFFGGNNNSNNTAGDEKALKRQKQAQYAGESMCMSV